MKKIAIIVGLLLFQNSNSQEITKEYNLYNYSKVIEKGLDKTKDNLLSLKESRELGNAYYFLNNYKEALPYLYNSEKPLESPELLFKIGHCYKANDEFEKGNDILNEYYSKSHVDYTQSYKDLETLKALGNRYNTQSLNKINTEKSELFNFEDSNFIYFSSNRNRNSASEKKYEWDEEYYFNMYKMEKRDSSISSYKKYNSNFHDSDFIMSENKEFGFYVSNISDETKFLKKHDVLKLNIYQINFDANGKVKRISLLPFNSLEYSCKKPFYDNKTGLLYFSSNMPQGKGGYDIYSYNVKTKSDLTNLTEINSIDDETDFFIDDKKNIYFTSNGYFGFGGRDIFTKQYNEEKKEYTRVMNIGLPINTKADDFGFVIKDKIGYFTSNIKGSEDIYKLEETKGLNLDYFTQTLYGRTVDINRKTIFPLDVKLRNTKTEEIISLNGATGSFSLELENNTKYEILLNNDDYKLVTTDVILNKDKFVKTNFNIIVEEKPCVSNYKGNVYNSEKGKGIGAISVIVYDMNKNVVAETKTDLKGDYNINLPCNQNLLFTTFSDSENPLFPEYNEYIKTGEKEKKIKDIRLKEVQTKGLIVNEKGELLIKTNPIYFDTGKDKIKDASKEELHKVLDILNYDSKYKLIINAHTDIKGNFDKNMILSNKRAESTAKYLISKGINPARIQMFGFGSTKPLIDCGLICTDLELSKNRRSEFVLLEE